MIAGKTVSRGSGGCWFPVTERLRFVKSSNRQSLPQVLYGALARVFVTIGFAG